MQYKSRRAIALMITLFFVIAITIAVGVGLKNVNDAKHEVRNENFMLQTTIVLNDIMNVLKNAPELNEVNSSEDMEMFLETYSMPVPLSSDIMVDIKLESARAKFNINSLEQNGSKGLQSAFVDYLNANMVNPQYYLMLQDMVSGPRADGSYATGIFNDRPYLFRDYISSKKQIEKVNEYYKQTYHENSIDKLDLEKIFYLSDTNTSAYTMDLNFALENRDVLNIMSGVYEVPNQKEKKRTDDEISNYISPCNSLSKEQKDDFKKRFNASCDLQKFIAVTLSIVEGDQEATIRFEYDLKNKKGSKFVYEI